jgi:hypothetical protein
MAVQGVKAKRMVTSPTWTAVCRFSGRQKKKITGGGDGVGPRKPHWNPSCSSIPLKRFSLGSRHPTAPLINLLCSHPQPSKQGPCGVGWGLETHCSTTFVTQEHRSANEIKKDARTTLPALLS